MSIPELTLTRQDLSFGETWVGIKARPAAKSELMLVDEGQRWSSTCDRVILLMIPVPQM